MLSFLIAFSCFFVSWSHQEHPENLMTLLKAKRILQLTDWDRGTWWCFYGELNFFKLNVMETSSALLKISLKIKFLISDFYDNVIFWFIGSDYDNIGGLKGNVFSNLKKNQLCLNIAKTCHFCGLNFNTNDRLKTHGMSVHKRAGNKANLVLDAVAEPILNIFKN